MGNPRPEHQGPAEAWGGRRPHPGLLYSRVLLFLPLQWALQCEEWTATLRKHVLERVPWSKILRKWSQPPLGELSSTLACQKVLQQDPCESICHPYWTTKPCFRVASANPLGTWEDPCSVAALRSDQERQIWQRAAQERRASGPWRVRGLWQVQKRGQLLLSFVETAQEAAGEAP